MTAEKKLVTINAHFLPTKRYVTLKLKNIYKSHLKPSNFLFSGIASTDFRMIIRQQMLRPLWKTWLVLSIITGSFKPEIIASCSYSRPKDFPLSNKQRLDELFRQNLATNIKASQAMSPFLVTISQWRIGIV